MNHTIWRQLPWFRISLNFNVSASGSVCRHNFCCDKQSCSWKITSKRPLYHLLVKAKCLTKWLTGALFIIATNHAHGNLGDANTTVWSEEICRGSVRYALRFYAGNPTRHRKNNVHWKLRRSCAMSGDDGSDQKVRKSIRPLAVWSAIGTKWTLISTWAAITWNLCY